MWAQHQRGGDCAPTCDATLSSVGDSGFTIIYGVDESHGEKKLAPTYMRASVYTRPAPWRHDEVSLRRDLTTRPLFKDAEHRNQTVSAYGAIISSFPLTCGGCCTSCFWASHNWSTKIDKDPQGIAIKPGTPLTSIVAPTANHATPTRSLEATDSSLNAPFDEKVAFMACPRHAADRQAVVAKRATF